MTTKDKPEAEAVEPKDVRVHIKLMSDEKTVAIDIEDLHACSKAKHLKKAEAARLQSFAALLQDIHDSNADATTVTLTPKNVEKVLGAEPVDADGETQDEAQSA
jgi:uncharacterized membrane protein YukC